MTSYAAFPVTQNQTNVCARACLYMYVSFGCFGILSTSLNVNIFGAPAHHTQRF